MGAETMPVPLGAGIKRTLTLPHFPVTLQGTVCGSAILLPQYPLRTGMMESLAAVMAPKLRRAYYKPRFLLGNYLMAARMRIAH